MDDYIPEDISVGGEGMRERRRTGDESGGEETTMQE